MGNKVAGSKITLLYGGILKPATATTPAVYAWQAAEEVGAESDGEIATMGQTDVGKLLADTNFQNAVERTADSLGRTKRDLLFGEDANGTRINSTSISDYASKHFSDGIEGKVQIMAGADISPDSILSKTEFSNVIEQNKYSDIDGITNSAIESRIGELGSTGASEANIYNIIRQDVFKESYVNTSANIKFTEPTGTTSRVGSIDTGNFFGWDSTAPRINTIPEGTSSVVQLSEWFDAAKILPVDGSLGNLGTAGAIIKNMITDESGGSGSISDLADFIGTDATTLRTALLRGGAEAIAAVGVAAIAADILRTSVTARTQLDGGDVAGAMQSVEALSARVGLGITGANAGWIAANDNYSFAEVA